MTHKFNASLIMFTVATLICGGVYFVFTEDRQRVLNEVEATKSYVETLETELEALQEQLTEMKQ